jgi:hypothetical protein
VADFLITLPPVKDDQLTESQVARVVEEVTRQAQLREVDQRQTLERKQVEQILDELKLPTELLDPAMRELERRDDDEKVQAQYAEELAARKRRTFWLVGTVAAVVLVIILVVGAFVQSRSRALADIAAPQPGRITRSDGVGGALGSVTRDGSEIYYQVTLERVPLDRSLSMKCNWIAPGGRIVKQNSWQTGATDKTVWPTHCRTTFDPSAPAGTWTVEMLLNDRILSRTDFRVE